MGNAKRVVGVVLTVMVVLCGGARAQSDCTNVLISMSPCLNYITGNSSTAPPSQCCSQLANVVRSSPKCLCDVLNGGGSQLGLSVNRTQAMALPGACSVQTPPVSACSGSSGGSPGNSPAGSPKNPGTDGGKGSKTVPSSEGDGSSGGSSTHLSLSLLAFFCAVAYAAIFNKH